MKVVEYGELIEVGDITADMLERKPLPIGRTQINEWCDRIIAASMVEASKESLKSFLCERLQHIQPTEAFSPDAKWILLLRTQAVKETAYQVFRELYLERHPEKRETAEATAPDLGVVHDGGVLEKSQL